MTMSQTPALLVVEENRVCHIDPQNPSALFSMWSVFSKASGLMEQGQRLEHMSWRLWAHQSIRERSKRQERSAHAHAHGLALTKSPSTYRPGSSDLPRLSSSVDSICSSASQSAPLPSSLHNVGSFHVDEMPAVNLKHLVKSIYDRPNLDCPIPSLPSPFSFFEHSSHPFDQQDSARTPRPTSPQPVPITLDSSASTINSTSTAGTPASTCHSSATSPGSVAEDHIVVRGFTQGRPTSYKSQTSLAPPPPSLPVPILKHCSESTNNPINKHKKRAKFTFGSGGSSDGCSTLQDNFSPAKSPGSSSAQPRQSAMKKPTPPLSSPEVIPETTSIRKKTTFELAEGEEDEDEDEGEEDEDEGAIEDESEEEDSSGDEVVIQESAIEDDEEAWEDEGDDDEAAKPLTFDRRAESLVSRRSAIWDGLHGWPDAPANQAPGFMRAASSSQLKRTRTSPPNPPSMADSVEDELPLNLQDPKPVTMSGPNACSAALHPTSGPPLSPVHTRKKMIHEELDYNLRKHMLNERKQLNYFPMKATELPRRHTSVDMRQLVYKSANAIPLPLVPTTTIPQASGLTMNEAWNADADADFESNDANYHQTGW